MSSFSLCAIIPTLNHYKVLNKVVQEVLNAGLPVIIVDDGSDKITADTVDQIGLENAQVTVLRHEANRGKGAAFLTGLQHAKAAGHSHALQIDADGQHDLKDLPNLISSARDNPNCLVTAKPVYDSSMPLGRKIGRWFTHVCVWVETLSFKITDSMCGFRIYPIAPTLDVISEEKVGQRMDFDTSVMVRLFWRGISVIEIPSKVIYPEDNTSNFDVVKDNILITRMHTRLVFGMLLRLITLRLGAKA
ncbi:glycosyltransferase [Sneathiella sp. P13V-1]|uniref:glycosyltransferase family 2 protein n=1 Tax=Sneathiella sp. P13V-1 TaxID=2697366 RepID=UPI00187B9C83|nr:glycosyltransferase family 2 protein [Sneathiella sp. P13V-1]MBE7636518.1 glycosyltransferase [Sneathiella sp. P13V-1]